MQKWEHRVLIGMAFSRKLPEQRSDGMWVVGIGRMIETLDLWGKEGWELVNATSTPFNMVAYLKRPI